MRLHVDMHTQIQGGAEAPVQRLRKAANRANDLISGICHPDGYATNTRQPGHQGSYRIIVVDGTIGEQVISDGATVAERELLDVAILGNASSRHGGLWRLIGIPYNNRILPVPNPGNVNLNYPPDCPCEHYVFANTYTGCHAFITDPTTLGVPMGAISADHLMACTIHDVAMGPRHASTFDVSTLIRAIVATIRRHGYVDSGGDHPAPYGYCDALETSERVMALYASDLPGKPPLETLDDIRTATAFTAMAFREPTLPNDVINYATEHDLPSVGDLTNPTGMISRHQVRRVVRDVAEWAGVAGSVAA